MHREPGHHCLPLPIMRFHRSVFLICALAMARPTLALEPRQVSIFLRAADGYLTVDRVRARPDGERVGVHRVPVRPFAGCPDRNDRGFHRAPLSGGLANGVKYRFSVSARRYLPRRT